MFDFMYFLDVSLLNVDEGFCYMVQLDTNGHTTFEIDTSTHTFKTIANCPGHDDYLDCLLKRESSTISICPTGHESFHLLLNETVQSLIHKPLANRETWRGKGKLDNIIADHAKWLRSVGGKQADLRWLNLRNVDLKDVNLRDSDLRDSDLSYADLSGSDLSGALVCDSDLHHANLTASGLFGTNLRCTNLQWANLQNASLCDSNLRGTNLRGANLRNADLAEADLRNVDLAGADTTGADLNSCVGDSKYIKSLFVFEEYVIVYTADRLQIGCENHSIEEWTTFDDDTIRKMDGEKGLVFWNKNKNYILSTVEQFPATATK